MKGEMIPTSERNIYMFSKNYIMYVMIQTKKGIEYIKLVKFLNETEKYETKNGLIYEKENNNE